MMIYDGKGACNFFRCMFFFETVTHNKIVKTLEIIFE